MGGPVQFWVQPKDISDLQDLVKLAYRKKMSLRTIGAGTNILVDDAGIEGIVVKLNAPCFKRIIACRGANLGYQYARGQQVISVGVGTTLARLVRYAQENGFSGFELLAGIPGTIGGALVMNSGNIGNSVLGVTVIDKQGWINPARNKSPKGKELSCGVKILNRRDIRFGYRSSDLGDYIILSAHFKLIKKDKRTIKKKIKEHLDYRRMTQDLSWPSAGCIFKNPSGRNQRSAAYFIERCGLKGSSFGGAAVSSKHANFIINKGKANFADILKLISYITRSVKKRFNLDLEPEIKIWK